jgi:LmbE family N-acetylglucosaminyl deacetylase
VNVTDAATFPGTGSILVVAHPDDEILWFGSILDEVDKIVVCFLNDPAHPELAEARQRVLAEHPLREKIVCLGADETGSFNKASWPLPKATKYGLRIVKDRKIAKRYRLCYRELRKQLAPMIRQATNVITHNPWGEYGHEEHVLVHRVATVLANSRRKPVWYGNHASTWSQELMRMYLDRSERQVIYRKVDESAMQNIANVYRANDAWTWFDDYRWFEDECFIRGPFTRARQPGAGWTCPVNLLRLKERN